ncbi:MAG: agmatine deiminase family protein [Candidatus Thermoplasmatota archaeon]|nr:agmatine deiminase family protein [Candidatus Thermoplasmatota archaeon]MBU1940683.1 agmatine deiminase family protein [Candidatus Thermoplasmatota archaeon]
MMNRPRTLHTLLICILLVFLVGAGSIQSIAFSISYESNDPLMLFAPPPDPIRNIAEFETMEGVLIRYPFGISYSVIAEMSEDVTVYTIVASSSEQSSVYAQYQSQGVNTANCEFLIAPSDSYWTRDYGPWFILNGNDDLAVIDFTYNRPRPNDNQIPSRFASYKGFPSYFMPLTHAGGNYMTDGQGISISTDLVWSENSGYTHSQIDTIVNDYLGITTYYVVPDVNGEYIKHIDCWGKYLAPDKILIREVPATHSQYTLIENAVSYFSSQTSCYGTPYEIYRVYTPNNQPYTNSLILNDKVLVPIMGSQWDDDAIDAYEAAMPGYEVLGFTGSWASTDALHCRAKGVPDPEMLYIEHTPLFGTINGDMGVDIQCSVFAYSGYSIDTTASMVYWKEDTGNWQTTAIQLTSGNTYQATITPQQNNATISYYIHAEDIYGKTANHPFIGAPDPHQFTVEITQTNTPPEQPQRPTGQAQGKAGEPYPYETMTTDSNGDDVYYMWDWGDGTTSDWLGPYTSGATCSFSHTWNEQGTYSIRVKAKDIHDAESEWSEPLSIKMPVFTVTMTQILERLIQRFPILSQIFYFLFKTT